MVMILFRLFLYLVCILSISWSVLVFAGPALITKIAVSYTDGEVELSNVRVTPTLGVSVGRLDYNTNIADGRIPISGFSRSTEITWSLSSNRPFLTLDVGPTVLNEILTVKNIKIHTLSYKSMDWDDLFLTAKTSGLTLQTVGKFDDLILEGNLNRGSSKIFNLTFDAKMINLQQINPSLSVAATTGELSEFDLSEPLGSQSLSGRFIANNISGAKPDFLVEDVDGIFDISTTVKNITFEMHNAVLSDTGVSVNKIKVDGGYDTEKQMQNVSINLFDGMLGNSAPNFSHIATEILKTDDYYDAFLVGDLGEFELYNGDNFIGLLPPSDFNINLEVDGKKSKLIADTKIDFDSSSLDDIKGSAKIELNLEPNNIAECAISECKVSDLDIEYQINFDDDWIKGRSNCLEIPCNFELMTHLLTTSNTASIFSTLNRLSILNPLSSLYLYSRVSAGQKIQDGHRLKF